MRKDGKSFANSARKAGHQRLRPVTRWCSPNIDTATDYVRQNPWTLDRSRFRVPTQKLEEIDLFGRFETAEIESYLLKGVGLNTCPVIESRNSDLNAFCQNMKNQLNAVDCAKLIDSKVPATWDRIDHVDYLKDDDLLISV